MSQKKGPAEAEPEVYDAVVERFALALRWHCIVGLPHLKLIARSVPGVSEWWAHQDSNLEQAGYEPAALTVELWARTSLKSQLEVEASLRVTQSAFDSPSTTFVPRETHAACGSATGGAACAAPWPRSAGCARA